MSEKQGNAQVELTQLTNRSPVTIKRIVTQEHLTSTHLQNMRTKTSEMLLAEIPCPKAIQFPKLNVKNNSQKPRDNQNTSKVFP